MIGMNLKREIDQIAKDKGIESDEITGALEEAMLQAARKRFGQEKEIEARYNDEIGEVELFEFREVVETISDEESQILIYAEVWNDPEKLKDAVLIGLLGAHVDDVRCTGKKVGVVVLCDATRW